MGARTLKALAVSLRVMVVMTVVTGVVYPLVVLGIAQGLFPGTADGSLVEADGRVVGSALAAQSFTDPGYFVSRPSATGYAADATSFANLGPDQITLKDQVDARIQEVLGREGPYVPGLTRAQIPVDMVTTGASGIDPDISVANAELQAARVAAVRGLSVDRVLDLIDDNTDGRDLGVLGEPGVNVLKLNIALDQEAS